MAVLGLGVDIVETARFNLHRRSERFFSSIFSGSERAYCLSKHRPQEHFAVRFAAKEAACKAFTAAGFGFISVAQIEVCHQHSGAPVVALRAGRNGEPVLNLPPDITIHVSLSHSRSYATAIVVVERIGH